jgi:L-rhamnose mutarotase
VTERHILILDLRDDPGLIARYEAHHAAGAVPTPIVRSIRDAGIDAMEIYRSGNRLVMVMETNEAFDAEAKAEADRTDPNVIAWERAMDAFQQALPWAAPGQKWVPAARIFDLNEQDR